MVNAYGSTIPAAMCIADLLSQDVLGGSWLRCKGPRVLAQPFLSNLRPIDAPTRPPPDPPGALLLLPARAAFLTALGFSFDDCSPFYDFLRTQELTTELNHGHDSTHSLGMQP